MTKATQRPDRCIHCGSRKQDHKRMAGAWKCRTRIRDTIWHGWRDGACQCEFCTKTFTATRDMIHGAIIETFLAPFHKRITAAKLIPGTRTSYYCDLDCGHRVQTFGTVADGVLLCTECRDLARAH
jgi:hypothetical protein